MGTRRDELLQRKDAVLGIVVNEYIHHITPVSSSYIVKHYPLDLSSATVRNILADLEREGFLTHPHTSAGRVPTQEGYRYYVDNLMNQIHLLEAEQKQIKEECRRKVKDLEVLLDRTSQVISDVTQYTGIVSIDGRPDRIFCRGTEFVVEYPDSRDVTQIREILHALEEKERILEIINRDIERKIKIYIGHELACTSIESCALAVSRYELPEGQSGRMAVLGPTRMDYQKVVSTLEYLSRTMNQLLG